MSRKAALLLKSYKVPLYIIKYSKVDY